MSSFVVVLIVVFDVFRSDKLVSRLRNKEYVQDATEDTDMYYELNNELNFQQAYSYDISCLSMR